MILAAVVVISFISVPFLMLAQNHSTTFFVLSSVVFVVCMAILLLMFVPKILYHRKIVLTEEGLHGGQVSVRVTGLELKTRLKQAPFPEQAPCEESITCSVCRRSIDEKASLVQGGANDDIEESKNSTCDEDRKVEPVDNK